MTVSYLTVVHAEIIAAFNSPMPTNIGNTGSIGMFKDVAAKSEPVFIDDGLSSLSSEKVSVSSPPSPQSRFDEDRQTEQPLLLQLRKEARELATQRHLELKSKSKLLVHAPKKPKKQWTKRQLSSKRSAEICRIKLGIYTELLERAVVEKEKSQHQLQDNILKQRSNNMALEIQIEELLHSVQVEIPVYETMALPLVPPQPFDLQNDYDGQNAKNVLSFGNSNSGPVPFDDLQLDGLTVIDDDIDDDIDDAIDIKREQCTEAIEDYMLNEPLDASFSPLTEVSNRAGVDHFVPPLSNLVDFCR